MGVKALLTSVQLLAKLYSAEEGQVGTNGKWNIRFLCLWKRKKEDRACSILRAHVLDAAHCGFVLSLLSCRVLSLVSIMVIRLSLKCCQPTDKEPQRKISVNMPLLQTPATPPVPGSHQHSPPQSPQKTSPSLRSTFLIPPCLICSPLFASCSDSFIWAKYLLY